jgi:hypothetical protein
MQFQSTDYSWVRNLTEYVRPTTSLEDRNRTCFRNVVFPSDRHTAGCSNNSGNSVQFTPSNPLYISCTYHLWRWTHPHFLTVMCWTHPGSSSGVSEAVAQPFAVSRFALGPATVVCALQNESSSSSPLPEVNHFALLQKLRCTKGERRHAQTIHTSTNYLIAGAEWEWLRQ